jgi:hypothetical protein
MHSDTQKLAFGHPESKNNHLLPFDRSGSDHSSGAAFLTVLAHSYHDRPSYQLFPMVRAKFKDGIPETTVLKAEKRANKRITIQYVKGK